MSQRELSRLDVFRQLSDKRLTQRQAASLLNLSTRQIIRLAKAFTSEGAAALVSKRRGRPSNNRLAAPLLAQAGELLREGLKPEQLAGPKARFGHGPEEVPIVLVPILAVMEEEVRAPFLQPAIKPTDTLHVPMFIHVMRGPLHEHEHEEGGGGPVVDRGEVLGGNLVPLRDVAAVRDLVGARGGKLVAVRGEEGGKESLPSLCFNGRSFVGNSPTIVAAAGQRIRWYVFNLDLGMTGTTSTPTASTGRMRTRASTCAASARQSLSSSRPSAPPVLLLSPEIEQYQDPGLSAADAQPFNLRGDFIFHCQSVADMQQGLVGLVRSTQTIWLTAEQAAQHRRRAAPRPRQQQLPRSGLRTLRERRRRQGGRSARPARHHFHARRAAG